MELRHLRYYVAVAEELHFGRAASRLGISQPPLSAQIRALEDEVGAQLLDRSRHHVALTDAGRAFLDRARDILGRASAMVTEAAGIARGEQGMVRLGYTATASYQVIPRLVATLRTSAPRLRLQLQELPSASQVAALRDGRIDVGLACFPVAAEDLARVTLVTERMVCALPAGHPLARGRTVPVRRLSGVPMVGLRQSTEPEWAALFAAELGEAGVLQEIVAEADTKLSLLGLVAAGLGVALLTSSLATVRRRGVTFRPLGGVRRALALGALHRQAPSALVQSVVAAARG